MRLVLRLARKLKHKFAKGPARKRIDRALLKDPNIEAAFIDQVKVAMRTPHTGTKLQPGRSPFAQLQRRR